MELTNGEIFGATKTLEELFSMELPVRTSMAIAKLSTKLSELFQSIDKVRNGLVTRYGAMDIKTNQLSITPESENWTKFILELNELMAQKTELVFDKIKLPQVIEGKPLMIKPSSLAMLDKFVELEALKSV